MKSCNITHQIVETVARYLSGTVQIDSVEALHDVGMIRYLKIRYHRFAVSLHFHVLAVVFSNRYAGIDDVRDGHHDLFDLLVQLPFLLLQLCQMVGSRRHLLLKLFGLFSLSLAHQPANLLGKFITFRSERIAFLLCGAV